MYVSRKVPRKARYKSGARRGFNYLLLGVEGLLALHEELHGKVGKPRRAVSDILRSALVLALAALDGVVLEAVIEAAPLAAKKGRAGGDLPKWIAAEPDLVLEGIAAGDPSASLAEVARANIARTTFQKADAIEGMLRGALGCEAPWDLAAETLSMAERTASRTSCSRSTLMALPSPLEVFPGERLRCSSLED